MAQLFWLSAEQVDRIRPLFPKERGVKRCAWVACSSSSLLSFPCHSVSNFPSVSVHREMKSPWSQPSSCTVSLLWQGPSRYSATGYVPMDNHRHWVMGSPGTLADGYGRRRHSRWWPPWLEHNPEP